MKILAAFATIALSCAITFYVSLQSPNMSIANANSSNLKNQIESMRVEIERTEKVVNAITQKVKNIERNFIKE